MLFLRLVHLKVKLAYYLHLLLNSVIEVLEIVEDIIIIVFEMIDFRTEQQNNFNNNKNKLSWELFRI